MTSMLDCEFMDSQSDVGGVSGAAGVKNDRRWVMGSLLGTETFRKDIALHGWGHRLVYERDGWRR